MIRTLVLALALLALPSLAHAAATPSPNLSDEQFLAADPTFQARVGESLLATCASISSEAIALSSLSLHIKRANFCAANVYPPTAFSNIKPVIAGMVASDANVIGDATAAGATPLTSTNASTQAALVTDAHIASAISGQFNALLVLP